MTAPKDIHRGFPDRRSAVRRARQLELTVKRQQIIGTNPHSHSGTDASLLPQPRPNAFAQRQQSDLDILLADKVSGSRRAVADALHRRSGVVPPDAGSVLPVGKAVEHEPIFTQKGVEEARVRLSQCANRMDAELRQLPCGGRADIEQVTDRDRKSVV